MADIDESLYKRPWTWPVPEMRQIGKPSKDGIHRKDGFEKATGKATYVRDVTIPGQLIAKHMICPYAHAAIVSMDSAPVEALPGVRAVVRWDDPDINWNYNQYWFLPGEGHYWGQPVGAIVIADTEFICDEALKVLYANTTWEEKAFILDWNEALEASAPLLRPDLNPDNNINGQRPTAYGDIEAGFEEADQILEWTLEKEEDVWAGVEPMAQIGFWKDDYFEGYYHGQCPTTAQMGLMALTTASKINLHTPYQGALLGGLVWIWEPDRQMTACAVCSQKVDGRPVKLLYDTSHFHGSGETVGTYKFKVGIKNNGEITALQVDSVWNGQTLHDQISKFREGTKVENIVYNDTWPHLSRRGNICYKHGGPACSILTQTWLHVGGELDMDPTLVAEINDGCDGEPMDWVNEHIKGPQGFDPSRDSLKEVHAIAKPAFDWDNKWHAPGTKILPNGKYHGVGYMSVIAWYHQAGTVSIALRMRNDGTVSILARHADGGWCGETSYCQIVADEVGISYDKVDHRPFDDLGFDCKPGGYSQGIISTAPAVALAAKKLKAQILDYACYKGTPGFWGMPGQPPVFDGFTPDELDIKDDMIFVKADPENTYAVASLASAHTQIGATSGGACPFNSWALNESPSEGEMPAMGRQCYFMEIEVDPDTGQVEIKQVITCHDTGHTLNVDAAKGQAYGGIYMGMGSSWMEQVYFDPMTGVKMNDNLIGYPIPLLNDVGPIEINLIETGLGYSAYGAFGFGESGAASTRVLGCSAIYNAIGKYIDDVPITPEKILKALGKV